jgi:hypothetical protein
MGKFTDKDIEKYNLIKDDNLKGCAMCYNQTHYIDAICETRFCSVECRDKFIKMFNDSAPEES